MKPEVVMQRRRFSREFKLEAVKLVRERGVSAAQAARDLDVHENVLRKWVKEFGSDPVQAFPGRGQMKPEQQEIERLRREVNKLKAERDILKNCPGPCRGLLREGSDMKFVFIAKHRNIWPVAWLCDALGVSRSGFHAWLNQSPSTRHRSDEAVGQQVKASFIASERSFAFALRRTAKAPLIGPGSARDMHHLYGLML
jgi:transposase-like protein